MIRAIEAAPNSVTIKYAGIVDGQSVLLNRGMGIAGHGICDFRETHIDGRLAEFADIQHCRPFDTFAHRNAHTCHDSIPCGSSGYRSGVARLDDDRIGGDSPRLIIDHGLTGHSVLNNPAVILDIEHAVIYPAGKVAVIDPRGLGQATRDRLRADLKYRFVPLDPAFSAKIPERTREDEIRLKTVAEAGSPRVAISWGSAR